MNTGINKWRLWSGIISVAMGVIGYFYLVVMCASGAIPIDMSMAADLEGLMQSMQNGTVDEAFVSLGCSGTVMEMLFIAGIVGIVTHKKRWFWNIPVALILGYGVFYGFMGFSAAYPWCIWAAACLFMSIVAMRSGHRAEREQQEAAAQPQQETASAPGMGAWQKPQSRPQQPAQYTAPQQPVRPEPRPEPNTVRPEPRPEPNTVRPEPRPEPGTVRPAQPVSEPEPEYTMPPQAKPIDDDEL